MIAAAVLSMTLLASRLCDTVHETPECATQLIDEATENLSLPRIQSEAESGAVIYRAVFDGGLDGTPAVSFERRRGQAPELVVYGAGGATYRRPISAEVWDEVRERSRYVGRRLDAPPYQVECIVSSDVVVQISRPRRALPNQDARLPDMISDQHDPSVIEASQNSCGGGLTWDYGAWLAELACHEVAECTAMGGYDDFMVAARNLGSVFLLQGDTVAAASLLSAKQVWVSSTSLARSPDASIFDQWLDPHVGATLVWADQAAITEGYPGGEIAEALIRLSTEMRGFSVVQTAFGAESPEEGWIEGVIEYDPNADGVWNPSTAAYRQVWVRSGNRWRLWSMTVGSFVPAASASSR